MKNLLVIRMQRNDSWNGKLEGLQQIAARRGLAIQAVPQPESDAAFKSLLSLWDPIAIVQMEGREGDRPLDPALSGVRPVIYLDAPFEQSTEKLNYVRHDAAAIVRLALKEFIRIGCRHFAYVGSSECVHWSEDKRLAFSRDMKLTGQPLHIFPETYVRQLNNADFTRELTAFLAALPAPCGILAVNDDMAERVLAAAQLAGRTVPDELAVIGVDNHLSICEHTRPTLSSIVLDFQASATAVFDIALQGLSPSPGGQSPSDRGQTPEERGQTPREWGQTPGPRHALIPPLKIERRQSTARYLRKDGEISAAVERIRKEACLGLTARDVFADFTCSRRMAEIRFRATVGRSVLEEIQRIRFEHVFDLLRSGPIPTSVLADRCGFKSVALLLRQFKRLTGTTPRRWQQNSQQT